MTRMRMTIWERKRMRMKNCKSSLNQKKRSRVLSCIFFALGLSAMAPSFKDWGSRWDGARTMSEQPNKLWRNLKQHVQGSGKLQIEWNMFEKKGDGRMRLILTVGLFDAPVGGVLPNGDTLLLELLLLLGISMYFGVCTLFRPWGGLFDNRSSSSSSSRR